MSSFILVPGMFKRSRAQQSAFPSLTHCLSPYFQTILAQIPGVHPSIPGKAHFSIFGQNLPIPRTKSQIPKNQDISGYYFPRIDPGKLAVPGVKNTTIGQNTTLCSRHRVVYAINRLKIWTLPQGGSLQQRRVRLSFLDFLWPACLLQSPYF